MAKKIKSEYLDDWLDGLCEKDEYVSPHIQGGKLFHEMFNNLVKQECYRSLFENCKEEYVDQVSDLIENCQFALLDQLLKTCVND